MPLLLCFESGSLITDPLQWLVFPRQSYLCPPAALHTLSAGLMRAADKRLQEVRPDYLLSEQSAAVTHIHAHIVRCTRDGIIAGLSNMCRPLTLELSALQAMTGPFSEFHALVRSQEQQTHPETGYWLSNGHPGTCSLI